MKRAAVLLLILLLLSGCASAGGNTYSDACFSATLPDGFTRVTNASILCFAPHGNPMRASSITWFGKAVYLTESLTERTISKN